MTATSGTDWPEEMSIADRTPPHFFRSRGQIDSVAGRVPQAHALRRAFDGLALDGILCLRNTPFLYFKEIPRVDPDEVRGLLRRFWNQGLAPVLILITPREVHVYSGLATPPVAGEDAGSGNRLVTTLDRLKDAARLRQLVLSLESGEFFRVYAKSFDPDRRVDRLLLKNLEATREELDKVSEPKLTARVLDALLCRVVFTCYLFDRKVIGPSYLQDIGISDTASLRDIMAHVDKTEARTCLYYLFESLGTHFNGDLFNDDLAAERENINEKHLQILDRFLRGADVKTGQGSFWPYDFSVIPIETISSIYEHFLKSDDPKEKKKSGAFYTPRFLAEIVLDLALEGFGTLLDKRFLDPACGSGIFLVGLFNRLAEEWFRKHPNARYDEQASGLMAILRENLYGVDRNATACRIAAFSLYLAMLDQLKPSDIQELQRKGKVLPPLVYDADEPSGTRDGKTIIRADFFTDQAAVPPDAFHLVVGNPPWASVSGPKVPAETWCESQEPRRPLANRQLAQAFVWKSPLHAVPKGRICFVLPHSVLFNQQDKAVEFQCEWLKHYATDLILNLADFQRFLFDAEGPAVVARFYNAPPESLKERIEYAAPKTDWGVSKAAVITVVAEDRTEILLREVLASLRDTKRPVVWKERFWGTPRDSKFLDRLADLPRLSGITRQPRERAVKPWAVAQGFKPEKPEAVSPKSKRCPWNATQRFLDAKSTAINLFVLKSDCPPLGDLFPWLHRLPEADEIFRAPHVLVTQGLKVAYSDFDVVFRHALQGIHGPERDKDLLAFLAAYLRSPVARYFLFHATANWGVDRSKVLLSQLLNAPFPLPEQTRAPEKSRAIVAEVAANVREATSKAERLTSGDASPLDMLGRRRKSEIKKLRARLVDDVQKILDELVYDYFEVDDVERVLIEDTIKVVIPSTRPSKASETIPTLKTSSPAMREQYKNLVCETLNDWADGGPYRVRGQLETSPTSGMGIVALKRHPVGSFPTAHQDEVSTELIPLLKQLQDTFKRELGSVEMLRGLKVFDRDTLYLIKPLSQRFWTRTAALNDADDIATTILMQAGREKS